MGWIRIDAEEKKQFERRDGGFSKEFILPVFNTQFLLKATFMHEKKNILSLCY